MQVSTPMLQLLLYQKARSDQAKIIPERDEVPALQQPDAENNCVKTITSEDYQIANEFAMNTSNKMTLGIEEYDTPILSTNAITLSSLSDAEIFKIKKVIYDLHHPSTTPTTPTEPTTPTDPGTVSFGFLSDFNDIDTMFTYINNINPTVTSESGIDAHAMWELTQRDDWEESNHNFFGNLNKNFKVIDADNNGILSKTELANFLGGEIRTAAEYLNKVEQYSEELQENFKSMSAEQKLQFAIEKAREYFEAVGLTEQLQSLDRLIRENKIGIRNLNEGKTYGPGVTWTLGAYRYWQDSSGNWISDDVDCYDNGRYVDNTMGIWLDKYYYCDRTGSTWYGMVETFVHELTHATASFHISDKPAWGEYVAYQTGEDYLDSIGNGKWDGNNEKTNIHEHIDEYYNIDEYGNPLAAGDPEREPIPIDKWWTYGNYA